MAGEIYSSTYFIKQNLGEGYPYKGMNQDQSNVAFENYVKSKVADLVKAPEYGIIDYNLDFNDIWFRDGAVLTLKSTEQINPRDIEDELDDRDLHNDITYTGGVSAQIPR